MTLSPDWILRAEQLDKSYREADQVRAVLREVDLEVAAGEVVALTGPSGSGKSTLLNLLAGTLEADAGRILLNIGETVCELTALPEAGRTRVRRRHIGYVFQFFNLVPTLTVRENVLLPLELNGLAALAGEALGRLDSLGLGHRLDDFPDHLSGGERQRTAIARALSHRPALVLADEPTGNLDAANTERVASLLMSHSRSAGSALVMATHNDAVAALADRVFRLGA